MKKKVVYNACYGGFGLSRKAAERLAQLGVESMDKEIKQKENDNVSFGDHFGAYNVPRHDPRLVQVVEELGKDANGFCADLQIEEIEGDQYRIDEYDGNESVECPNSIDWITIED